MTIDGMRGRPAKGDEFDRGGANADQSCWFVSTIILAQLLVPADFGLVAIASTVMVIISSITELSLAEALVQHRDPSDDHFQSVFTLNMLRSVLLASIVAACTDAVSRLCTDDRPARPPPRSLSARAIVPVRSGATHRLHLAGAANCSRRAGGEVAVCGARHPVAIRDFRAANDIIGASIARHGDGETRDLSVRT